MIPQTPHAAKTMVARKRQEYYQLLDGHGLPEYGWASEVEEEICKELKRKQKQTEGLNLKLYSLPWIRPYMSAWMVDVKFGTENPFNKDEGGEPIKDAQSAVEQLLKEPSSFSAQHGGSLAQVVEETMRSLKMRITDRGAGDGGSHIGCWCSDAERDLLINTLNFRFAKAIKSGMMAVVIAWFDPKFDGLRTKEQVEEFLSSE